MTTSLLPQRMIRRTCLAACLGVLIFVSVPVLVEPLNLLSTSGALCGYVYSALFIPFLIISLAFWVTRSLDLLENKLTKSAGEDSA